jgi:hypothetical protein
MSFRVGQRVVCIDDHREPDEPPPYVVKNQIYTVAASYDDLVIRDRKIVPHPVIDLFELARIESDVWTSGFDAHCFRPVIEKKTDISVFTALLKQKQREHEPEFTI